MEIIDNYYNGNDPEWNVSPWGQTRTKFFGACSCCQYITIRNNLVVSSQQLAGFEGPDGAGYCLSRSSKGLIVDSNIFFHNWKPDDQEPPDDSIVGVSGCNTAPLTIEDITITNNMIYAESKLRTGFDLNCGVSSGEYTYDGAKLYNNTVRHTGSLGDSGVVNIGCGGSGPGWPVDIKNNIFDGVSGSMYGIVTEVGCDVSSTLTSDYNVYDSSMVFRYPKGTTKTFSQWQALGWDANSKQCSPTYYGGSDTHLGSSDTCAIDAGTSLISEFSVDKDGDSRAGLTWDIGADEYVGDYTLTGACCDSTCAITTDAACADWQGAGTTCTPDPCLPPEGPEPAGFAEGTSIDGVRKD